MAWYFACNVLNRTEFTDSKLLKEIKDFSNRLPGKTVPSSLKKYASCLIRMYAKQSSKGKTIAEDSLDYPFADLGLIDPTGDNRRYSFRVGYKPTLAPEVIYFEQRYGDGTTAREQWTCSDSSVDGLTLYWLDVEEFVDIPKTTAEGKPLVVIKIHDFEVLQKRELEYRALKAIYKKEPKLLSLLYSFIAYTATAQQNNILFVFFVFASTYSLIATLFASNDVIQYAMRRSSFLKKERNHRSAQSGNQNLENP